MTARVQTVNVFDVDPEGIDIEVHEKAALFGLGGIVNVWTDLELPIEAQLNQLAKIGETIRELALTELTRLVNQRTLAELAEVSNV